MKEEKNVVVIEATENLVTRARSFLDVHDILWCAPIKEQILDQIEEKLCLIRHRYFGWLIGNICKIFRSDKVIGVKGDLESDETFFIPLNEIDEVLLVKQISRCCKN